MKKVKKKKKDKRKEDRRKKVKKIMTKRKKLTSKKKRRQTYLKKKADREIKGRELRYHKGIIFASLYTIIKTKWTISIIRAKLMQ